MRAVWQPSENLTMLWIITTPPCDKTFLGDFTPERVIVEYDGPRVFTVDSNGKLLLAYHCDEDDRVWRYTVVSFSQQLVERLVTGKITIVEALSQPWSWIVDVDDLGEIVGAWSVDPAEIPSQYRPATDVRLVDRQHDDFSVKLIGQNITESGVALSVIRSASERTHKAIRKLVDHIGTHNGLTGFSDRDSRRHSDMTASYVHMASFEISIVLPDPDPLPVSSVSEDVLFAKELRRLVGKVIGWSANPELMDEPDTRDPSESVAILQSIEDLTPSGRNDDSEVQIGGKLVTAAIGRKVSLRKDLRPRLRAAIKRRVETGSLTGWVEQLPKLISAFGMVGTLCPDQDHPWFLLKEIGAVFYLDSGELFDEGDWMYGDRILFAYDSQKWWTLIATAIASGKKVSAVGALISEPIADTNLNWPRTSPTYTLLDLKLD